MLVDFVKSKLRKNSRITAFLVCVLIAAFSWILNALSKDYSHTFVSKIVYAKIPVSDNTVKTLPQQAEITVNTSGYNLLWFCIDKPFKKLKVGLDAYSQKNYAASGNTTVSLQTLAEKQFSSSSFKNNSFTVAPAVITFLLSSEFRKKVAVKTNLTVNYKKQFGLAGKITTAPDSVVFSGSKEAIEKIVWAETEIKTLKDLNGLTELKLALINPDHANLFMSDDSVTVTIPVEEYTEGTVRVKLRKTQNEELTFIPDEVLVTYRTTLKNFAQISASSFVTEVQTQKNKNGDAMVQITQSPASAEVVFINPSFVTCLKKQ